MAELICRSLREGALDGEHAPALTIKDSIESPFGPHVFNHVLTQLSANILASKSQSRGLVLVALSQTPSFYFDLLQSRGNDVASFPKWLRVLDCYTDPLGWKIRLMECGSISNRMPEASNTVRLCKDVRNLENLSSSIFELGRELVGQAKGPFSVAIDSRAFWDQFDTVRPHLTKQRLSCPIVLCCLLITSLEILTFTWVRAACTILATEMLRHASISSVAAVLSNFRSHDEVSCAFWLSHTDLHEVRVTAVLEYMSSMLANIEPMTPPTNVQRGNSDNLSPVEQNSNKGKFHVRLKRRNGRVRLMTEEFCIEQSNIKFTAISSEDGMITQSLVPKVQFNLQLSEKERIERAKVVLPFEHQGTGKPIEIYDGRQSPNETNIKTSYSSAEKMRINHDPGKGEIIYFRDSDDEMPDSDEDPYDNLDI